MIKKYIAFGLGIATLEVVFFALSRIFSLHGSPYILFYLCIKIFVFYLFFHCLVKKGATLSLACFGSYVIFLTIFHFDLIPNQYVHNLVGYLELVNAVGLMFLGVFFVAILSSSLLYQNIKKQHEDQGKFFFPTFFVVTGVLLFIVLFVAFQNSKKQSEVLVHKNNRVLQEQKLASLQKKQDDALVQGQKSISSDKNKGNSLDNAVGENAAAQFLGIKKAKIGEIFGSLTLSEIEPDWPGDSLSEENIQVSFTGDTVLSGKFIQSVPDGVLDCTKFELDQQSQEILPGLKKNDITQICLYPRKIFLKMYEENGEESISIRINSFTIHVGYLTFPRASAQLVEVVK